MNIDTFQMKQRRILQFREDLCKHQPANSDLKPLHAFGMMLIPKTNPIKMKSEFMICRLQLKRGLFWYRHYPKLHEMVKYRSSRAEILTNLRGNSTCVFFIRKNVEK